MQFPFVKSIEPVATRIVRRPLPPEGERLSKRSDLTYGESLAQNQMLDIPAIHKLGYDGSGVTIAVFDSGFDMEHPAFDQMHISDYYDFIEQDRDVNGRDTLYEHGTMVLSVLGAYYPGELIGPAYGATYLLARTEETSTETRVEEHYWLAAVEWADSLGADIISSSLLYFDFDGTKEDYSLRALDGNTTIVTRAANIAAERGILVVNAIGNEGPGDMSLWAPADSPNILSVGAIYENGDITNFSGRGPTYDGRIKPDVVAMGSSLVVASGTNHFSGGTGTSFATPLIAGLAAQLLDARPGLSPNSVISLFHQNGDRSESPNNTYGFGIPKLISLFEDARYLDVTHCAIFPNPSAGREITILLSDPVASFSKEVSLYDIRGRFIAQLESSVESSFSLQVTLPGNETLANQLYIISLEAYGKRYSAKVVYIKT